MAEHLHTPAQSIQERRQNSSLRSVFQDAYKQVEPCFDPKQAWGGVPLEMLAFRVLRSTYPALSSKEANLLVAASVRVYRTNHPDKAEHLPLPSEIILSY